MKLSSSEFEVDLDDLDEDEHDARRSKPEEVTVHFLMSFLQFALNLCLLQDEGDHEVRPRVERLKATIHIAGHDISAEDDGGICSMYRDTDGWRMIKPYLALIEAKRAFKYLDFDERTGKPKPVVSNETLAQYLAEAVISWRANRGELGQDVFLLAATNTFLRVIHFKFGSHYGEYVNTESEGTQKILVDNENKDTFIYIHSTKWFDLYEYTTLTLMEFADKHKDILKDVSKILGWLANVSSVGKSDMEQLKAKFDDLKL
ncbi:hypothetical protein CBS147326_7289 [Penicillium roqueforti]|nr:hypothetical protein CBS147326_7289 [Penicillium roqueforti]